MEEGEFLTGIELVKDYKFRVNFHNVKEGEIMMDEPEPLGGGDHPNAGKLLAAAVGNCLAASLLFCLRKSRIEARGMKAEARVRIVRNERGRLRIGKITVEIDPGLAEEDRERAARCVTLFEDFCVVTQSVRTGIDVKVAVEPVPAS